MKIVYISNSIIPSRTANSIHVMKMCQAFADNGHDVVLLASDRDKEYEEGVKDVYEYYGVRNNFKIKKLTCPNIKGKTYVYMMAILFYLLFNKADLVYGRFLAGCYISSKLGFKTIFESHAPIWKESNFNLKLFNKLIDNSNFKQLVVISSALKKMYIDHKVLDENKIQVAHDGADDNYDCFNVLTNKKLKVGYFGHLYKGRGVGIILEIAEKLPDITFEIFGGTQEDIDYWGNKITLKNVDFYGFINPNLVAKYRNECDILVAPYQEEVAVSGGAGNTVDYMSPLKIFEYMSSKKAIISSDLPALREVLNSENSILVECDNVAEWVSSIKKLQNDTIRNNLASKAYDDFRSLYTWDHRSQEVMKSIF
jgi:glycosyltransferase involved in cell wall biosynthesis